MNTEDRNKLNVLMEREKRNQVFQPIFTFLAEVVRINSADLDTVKNSDQHWFEEFAFSITIPELLALYWRGINQGRNECIQITDDLAKESVNMTGEWTPLGIIEECGDMIRELPQWDSRASPMGRRLNRNINGVP